MSEITEMPVLEQIIAGFDRMRGSMIRHASITSDVFNYAVKEVPNEGVRAHHVAAFAEQSRRYPQEDVSSLWGFYVSALASICEDKTAEVSTENLVAFPMNVGSYLKNASLTVIGNVGNGFGQLMRSGKLTLVGNAKWGVGYGMKGGEIVIKGNCGQGVGDRMDGKTAIIRIFGAYESLGRPIVGEIYKGAEKVWPLAYGRKPR